MARIIYSALVTSINGSIGGTTFQRNAYGHTVKKKPNIVNPNTIRQAPPRRALQTLAGIWATMTIAQRNAWDAYATANPVPSRLNPASNLTGHAQWIRINLLRLQAGFSVLITIVSSAQSVLDFTGPVLTNTAGVLTYGDDATDTLDVMQVNAYASAPVKSSIRYDKSRTRFMGTFDLTGAGIFANITNAYVNTFGSLIATGQYAFIRPVYWNRNNGQVIYTPSVNQLTA